MIRDKRHYIIAAALGGLLAVTFVEAAPRLGHAVVMGVKGGASYESPDGTHEIKPGMALSAGNRLETEDNTSMCVVLTPGAILCVDESTSVLLKRLEMLTAGLPDERKAAKRYSGIELQKGAILIKAGNDDPNFEMTVETSAGTVAANGGQFVVIRNNDGTFILVEKGTVVLTQGEKETTGQAGDMLEARTGQDPEVKPAPKDTMGHTFKICREFSSTLDPFTDQLREIGMGELAGWSRPGTEIRYVGQPLQWFDVSASGRIPPPEYSVPSPGASEGAVKGQRKREWAWAWYHNVAGQLRGFNYVPRTAVNSTDMWQADTFDKDTIEQELGWAQDSGHNSVRLFLQYLVWQDDPDGLKDRMDTVLKIADDKDLKVNFVLFDDSKESGKEPYLGEQDAPVPGVHNSGWTPSPGHDLVVDRGSWDGLEQYVKDVIGSFKSDKRVLMWDLYSNPGGFGMDEKCVPLLQSSFEWAREAKPSQPLTAGVWSHQKGILPRTVMELSDVVTLHAYENVDDLSAQLMLAESFGRPVIVTEWLRRSEGNTFEKVLPIFAAHRVGWYHWGLVFGKAQMYMPWTAKKGDPVPDVWEHDLLNDKGEAYDKNEVELIKGFQFN